jgi:hypothetical protein
MYLIRYIYSKGVPCKVHLLKICTLQGTLKRSHRGIGSINIGVFRIATAEAPHGPLTSADRIQEIYLFVSVR